MLEHFSFNFIKFEHLRSLLEVDDASSTNAAAFSVIDLYCGSLFLHVKLPRSN